MAWRRRVEDPDNRAMRKGAFTALVSRHPVGSSERVRVAYRAWCWRWSGHRALGPSRAVSREVVPDQCGSLSAPSSRLAGMLLVDVPDEAPVDAETDQLLQAVGEATDRVGRDSPAAGSPAGGCSRRSSSWRCPPVARSVVVLAPPPCQRLPCQTSTLPLAISAGNGVVVPEQIGGVGRGV